MNPEQDRHGPWDSRLLYIATIVLGMSAFILVPLQSLVTIAVGVAEGGPLRDWASKGTPSQGDTSLAALARVAATGPILGQAATVQRAAYHLERAETDSALEVLRASGRNAHGISSGPDRLLLARLLAQLGRGDPRLKAESISVYAQLVAAMPFDPDLAEEARRAGL